MTFEFGQHSLGVLLLNSGDVLHITEEKILDLVRHVQRLYHIIDPQTSVNVLVCMAADVEVAGHFFNCEIAN
jgi:hypothetical protein